MSITVRQWSLSELEAVGKDKWLATLLMNRATLSSSELFFYPYSQRRTYHCTWDTDDETRNDYEPITIYATDVRMLLRFIDEEYTRRPDRINQVITQYRPVKTS